MLKFNTSVKNKTKIQVGGCSPGEDIQL